MKEAPEIETQNFVIDENMPEGENVGSVVAIDPDLGQSLTYSILSGNSGEAFEINSNNGMLSVANSSALNYELIPSLAC
ncbi:MAG: cadherin repeat domain-containing protein [Bacteroidales bacterium]